jgi:arylsulfatase A-like enzyme
VMLPNVILVILDSARRDMFGCYGAPHGLTPNFDRLAAEGMLLWDHYAAGCGSAQAHVSTFTGQHSARHRMVHNLCDVRPDLLALPRLLQAHEYKTFGHSKASFIPPAGHEDLFGFDEMIYPGKASARRTSGPKDLALDTLRRAPWLFNALKSAYGAIRGRERQTAAAARYFDGHSSFGYLHDRLVEWKGRAPVFAYTTVLHPHTPYFPPKKYVDRVFKGERIHPQALDIQANFHAYANGDLGDTRQGLESLKKLYMADLLYGDEQLGTFTQRLQDAGILDDSILIVTSDHGEMFGEHGLANHGATVWEELFSTPLLIRYPKKIAAGTVVRRLTSALDILPTVFDLLGKREWLEGRTVLDGEAIRPEMGADDRTLVIDSPPAVLPERFRKYPNVLYMLSIISRAVRTSSLKYIWQSNGQHFLFRVGDPEDEAHNQYQQLRGEAERLHSVMVDFYQQRDPGYALDKYPIALSRTVGARMTNPVVREELRRLGYL